MSGMKPSDVYKFNLTQNRIVYPASQAVDLGALWAAGTLSSTGTCTATIDSGNAFLGVNPVKIVQGTTNNDLAKVTLASSQDFGIFHTFTFAFKANSNVVGTPGLTAFYVYFGFADGTFTSYRISTNEQPPGTWNVMTIYRNDETPAPKNFHPGGGIDYFSDKLVTSIGVLCETTANQATSSNLWFVPLAFNAMEKPTVMLRMDGCYKTQYQFGFPLLQKFGLKCHMAVEAFQLGTTGYMTTAQVTQMYNAGHPVIMHSYSAGGAGTGSDYANATSYPTSGLSAAVAAEIANFKSLMVSNGWTQCITPSGKIHAVSAIENPFDPTVGSPSQTDGRMQTLATTLPASLATYWRGSAGWNTFANGSLVAQAARGGSNKIPLPWAWTSRMVSNTASPVSGSDINSSATAISAVQQMVRLGVSGVIYWHDIVMSGTLTPGGNTAQSPNYSDLAVLETLFYTLAQYQSQGLLRVLTVDQLPYA